MYGHQEGKGGGINREIGIDVYILRWSRWREAPWERQEGAQVWSLNLSFLAVTIWWGWVWSGRVRDGRGVRR